MVESAAKTVPNIKFNFVIFLFSDFMTITADRIINLRTFHCTQMFCNDLNTFNCNCEFDSLTHTTPRGYGIFYHLAF